MASNETCIQIDNIWNVGGRTTLKKYVVTTENGYRSEFYTKEEAIADAKIVENSILHPIAFIHEENAE